MIYFQIEEEKAEKVTQHLEKGIHCIEKAMQCIEDMMQGGSMGERAGMGYRDGGGGTAAFRDDDDDMMGERMGMRRGVRGTGRYGMRMGYREPTPYFRPY